MTPAEYLPFERGLKDGLVVYWQRLKTFLVVMAVTATVLGMVGAFFVPSEPRSKDLRDVYEHPELQIRIIIFSSIACATLALLVRRFLSFSLGVTYRSFSRVWQTLLILALTTGGAALIWGYHWDVMIPATVAALASLFDAITLFRHDRADDHRHRSSEHDE
jgi:hypothetical protein